MRITIAALALLAGACAGNDTSSEPADAGSTTVTSTATSHDSTNDPAAIVVDCVRSTTPDVGRCSQAFALLTTNPPSDDALDALDSFNYCQAEHATGPSTAPECADEAVALVDVLDG